MDYKQFRRKLCDTTGRPAADIDALVQGLSMTIRKACSELDSVAIPTFGTFVPVKHDETVSTDLSSGKRMLMPPEVIVEFHPGSMLLKRLRNE